MPHPAPTPDRQFDVIYLHPLTRRRGRVRVGTDDLVAIRQAKKSRRMTFLPRVGEVMAADIVGFLPVVGAGAMPTDQVISSLRREGDTLYRVYEHYDGQHYQTLRREVEAELGSDK